MLKEGKDTQKSQLEQFEKQMADKVNQQDQQKNKFLAIQKEISLKNRQLENLESDIKNRENSRKNGDQEKAKLTA